MKMIQKYQGRLTPEQLEQMLELHEQYVNADDDAAPGAAKNIMATLMYLGVTRKEEELRSYVRELEPERIINRENGFPNRGKSYTNTRKKPTNRKEGIIDLSKRIGE